jgi:uncharacterized protein
VTPIFADTFYWIALANPSDDSHQRVVDFSRILGSALILTTDEVLTEFLTFFASDSQLRVQAAAAVQDILGANQTRVIPQTRASFLAGLKLYRARPDKRYSLTDCISMETMRRERITDVLTNDRHFQQEGFRPIFRDS